MRGAMPMEIIMAVVLVIIVVAIAFGYWLQTDARVSGSVPRAIECIFGVLCVAALKKSDKPPKKGIVLTTTMLATVVFLVVVAFVIFLVFAGLQAEAGSTSSGFAFGAFDAIMRLLPGG